MKPVWQVVGEKPWLGWLLFLGTVGVVFAFGVFASSLIERKREGRLAFQQVVSIGELESDSAVWGKNYPREYETWQKTLDGSFESKHMGSKVRDSLAEDPRWVVMWAGYAFAKDYNQARGHMHAVEDVRNTLRTGIPQPGTCWSCKSSDVPRLMSEMGIANFYKAKWEEIGPQIRNPIGCLDCHDPETQDLRISRPALVEAFQARGEDISTAKHQEMRSLVCAQCHVEYYFKGEGKYLTFPWDKGFTAEEMEAYYDEVGHTDFVHALSKAKMLKPQHPDWELFRMGIHAQRGLSCADCHMPYEIEGGMKFSSHHVVSPLANIGQTCAVCHRESEETLRQNVVERQDKVKEMLSHAQDALVAAHVEAKAAWEAGATEQEMGPALLAIRHAQWRADFVAASVGAAFHAPVESARLLASSLSKAAEARLLLSRVLSAHGVAQPVPLPDISTKEKAQTFIGLDIPAERAKKEEWKKTVLTEWLKN